MSEYACIVCNGEFSLSLELEKLLNQAAFIIAADGGLSHLDVLGIAPSVIVGDMDSVEPSLLDKYRTPKLTASRDKSETDTELAIKHCFESGYTKIFLIGATGGRLDHEMANIGLAAMYSGQLFVADKHGLSFVLGGVEEQKVKFKRPVGSTVSIVPFGKHLPFLTTDGLTYALDCEYLQNPGHGVSNLVARDSGCFIINHGDASFITVEGIFPFPEIILQ